MLLTGALLVVTKKKQNPRQIVSTLAVEFDRRFKLKVDEVELLLRFLYGYNSVCFLKLATPLRLLARLN